MASIFSDRPQLVKPGTKVEQVIDALIDVRPAQTVIASTGAH
ncbi:hypothetical protein [Burkholderia vietnamiensis]|nr:hypothetical protein [Burkholderia vietnamiensis]